MTTLKYVTLWTLYSLFTLSFAATINVYHTDDLQTAIDNASSGDTLVLVAGGPADYHHADEVTIDKDLTIEGDSAWTWVNASGADYAFKIVSGVTVTMTDLRIMGAYGDTGVLNLGELELEDCQVDSNTGTYGGIGNMGTLYITDCFITYNTSSSGVGGGVSNLGGTLTISSSYFISNEGYLGGGFHNSGGTASVVTTTFISNHADNKGGVYSNHNTGGTVSYAGSNSDSSNSADYGCNFYYDINKSPTCQ